MKRTTIPDNQQLITPKGLQDHGMVVTPKGILPDADLKAGVYCYCRMQKDLSQSPRVNHG